MAGKSVRFNRAIARATVVFAFIFATFGAFADTADGPATGTVRQLLASIGKLRTTTDSDQRGKLVASIDNSLAIDSLSRQALGAQWSKLDAAERARFVSLVKKLLEAIAYPNAAQFFSGFTVNFLGEETRNPDHIVKTTVSRPEGGAVSIDYVLQKMDGRWVVVDVILDRQSLAATTTSQIQATLRSGSYPDLVRQLEERLAQANKPAEP